jgi:hypothetical protein
MGTKKPADPGGRAGAVGAWTGWITLIPTLKYWREIFVSRRLSQK